MRAAVSEQAIAEVVVAWLEALGADVFQEVTVSGGVADIVARVRAEVWIVEVKSSLSLALLYQAIERKRLAHRVFVAAPYSRTVRSAGQLCDAIGIGLLVVKAGDFESRWEYDRPRVDVIVDAPRLCNRPVKLAERLQPEHKTHAKAGAVGAGGRWTPFRRTCEQLAGVVRVEPGIAMKDAIARIEHHYRTPSSARSSLAHWISVGKVDGVRLERGALFPVEPVERRT